MFNKIDLESWNRKRIYNFFTKETGGSFSVSANIDITSFKHNIKNNAEKFFPNLLFGICSVINNRQEFKMDIDENGNLGYYDIIHPCYTVFHQEEEMFTLLWTEFSDNKNTFMLNYNNDMDLYGNKPFEQKDMPHKNIFHISAMPWLSFTGVNLSMQDKYENLIPLYTIGKFFEENGKIMLPFAIHANHATLDGFHVSRLFAELEEWFGKYSAKQTVLD